MLDVITIRFTNKMNKELEQPIIEKKLKRLLKRWQQGRLLDLMALPWNFL